MPLSRRRGYRRVVALTSLIDVIFILLLFFMLTSTFTRFGELPVSSGATGGGTAESSPLFLQLGTEGLMLNGSVLQLDELPSAIETFRPEEGEALSILVSLDEGVTSQRLVDLLAALRPFGWASVTVLE